MKEEGPAFDYGPYRLDVGSNTLEILEPKPASAVTVLGQDLLSFIPRAEPDVLLLSMSIRDADGNSLLEVRDSEVTLNIVDNWDITWRQSERLERSTLTVRTARREIAVRVQFYPNRRLVKVESAKLHAGGRLIEVQPAQCRVDGSSIDRFHAVNSDVMLAVGAPLPSGSCGRVII